MEPTCSLPYSQDPAICTYPEADDASPRPVNYFFIIRYNITLPSASSSSKRFHCFSNAHQTPVCNSVPPHTCQMFAELFFLDVITQTIFEKAYKTRTSSLCNIPHSPAASYPLDPNIILST